MVRWKTPTTNRHIPLSDRPHRHPYHRATRLVEGAFHAHRVFRFPLSGQSLRRPLRMVWSISPRIDSFIWPGIVSIEWDFVASASVRESEDIFPGIVVKSVIRLLRRQVKRCFGQVPSRQVVASWTRKWTRRANTWIRGCQSVRGVAIMAWCQVIWAEEVWGVSNEGPI